MIRPWDKCSDLIAKPLKGSMHHNVRWWKYQHKVLMRVPTQLHVTLSILTVSLHLLVNLQGREFGWLRYSIMIVSITWEDLWTIETQRLTNGFTTDQDRRAQFDPNGSHEILFLVFEFGEIWAELRNQIWLQSDKSYLL